MFNTRMTELLGVEYPIQCGTMQWLSRAELVAAVANAGAFACIPAATFATPEDLLEEIRKTRDLTDKPFGVNVSLFPALVPRPPEELIETVIASGVKILETAGRNPEPYRQMISDAGLVHIHKCARVRDAVKVDKMGVDMVSIVGTECGGHPSMEGVTSLILIPQAVDAVTGPVIAGGGFCDGRSLVIALAMGAAGVNMGTRFMATRECTIHQNAKQRMVESAETDTVLVMQSLGNPSRAMKTPWTEKILEMESKGAKLEELAPMITGKAGLAGWQAGNVDQGIFPCGQVVGRIRDVPSVSDTVRSIVGEAVETAERVNGMLHA